MPSVKQWIQIEALTKTQKEMARRGETVVTVLDRTLSKVVGSHSAFRSSSLVRVQLGGTLISVYAPYSTGSGGEELEAAPFTAIRSSDVYWLVIHRGTQGKEAFGPVCCVTMSKKKVRGRDTKGAGTHVFVFSTLMSGQTLVEGARSVKDFHSSRGVRL